MAEGGRRLVVPGESEDVEEKLSGRGAEDAGWVQHTLVPRRQEWLLQSTHSHPRPQASCPGPPPQPVTPLLTLVDPLEKEKCSEVSNRAASQGPGSPQTDKT